MDEKPDRDAERVGDLLNGLVAALELLCMAVHPRPEYVECRDCEAWRGSECLVKCTRPNSDGKLVEEQVRTRDCRRHPGSEAMPFEDFGCCEGIRKPGAGGEG